MREQSKTASSLLQPAPLRPRSLQYAKELTPSARAIYAAFSRIARHRTRGVRISNAQLARESGTSDATVTRCLPELQALGLIVRTYTPGPSERYSRRSSEYLVPWHPIANHEAEEARRAAERKAAGERERRARKAALEAERRRRIRELDAARQLDLDAARVTLEAARVALGAGDQDEAARLYTLATNPGGVRRDQPSSCNPSPGPSPPFGGSGNPEPYTPPRSTATVALEPDTRPVRPHTQPDPRAPLPVPPPSRRGAPPPSNPPTPPDSLAPLAPNDERGSAASITPEPEPGSKERGSAASITPDGYAFPQRATVLGAPPPVPPGQTDPPEPHLGPKPRDVGTQLASARAWLAEAAARVAAQEALDRARARPNPARAARTRIRSECEFLPPVFASDTIGPEVEQCRVKVSK